MEIALEVFDDLLHGLIFLKTRLLTQSDALHIRQQFSFAQIVLIGPCAKNRVKYITFQKSQQFRLNSHRVNASKIVSNRKIPGAAESETVPSGDISHTLRTYILIISIACFRLWTASRPGAGLYSWAMQTVYPRPAMVFATKL